MHYTRGKEVEHQVIVYCKENQDKRVIDAIAYRAQDRQKGT